PWRRSWRSSACAAACRRRSSARPSATPSPNPRRPSRVPLRHFARFPLNTSGISADNRGVRFSRVPLLTLVLGLVLAWVLVYELDVLTHAVALNGLLLGRPAHLITDAAAGVVCVLAALRHHGRARLAWLLVAAGIFAWTAGDTYWTYVLLNDPH